VVFKQIAAAYDEIALCERRPRNINATGRAAATLAVAETGVFCWSCNLEFHIAAKAVTGVYYLVHL